MKTVCTLLMIVLCWNAPVRADENTVCASLSSLVEEAIERDGKMFEIRGELIGEPIFDHYGMWLNILEEGNCLAVFCPQEFASACARLVGGSHARQGHRLRFTGRLNRVCLEHGADHDFHTTSLNIEVEPRETADQTAAREVWSLLAVLIPVIVLHVRSRRAESK